MLHRIHVHPERMIGALSSRRLCGMVTQACEYRFDLLRWKKALVLRQRHAFFHPRCRKLYR